MTHHTGRLVLAPMDSNLAPDRTLLTDALAREGFLGPALGPGLDTYAVGENFLQLVAFTGCAVQVEINPEGAPDRPFCHVRIAGPYPAPLTLVGRNTRPPRCPACRARLGDWRRLLDHSAFGRGVSCPACARRSPLYTWDWKETGGFARLSVWVEEVFPGEAAPTDALMQLLARATGSAWRHFYVQD
jgi:hypothetical protein